MTVRIHIQTGKISSSLRRRPWRRLCLYVRWEVVPIWKRSDGER